MYVPFVFCVFVLSFVSSHSFQSALYALNVFRAYNVTKRERKPPVSPFAREGVVKLQPIQTYSFLPSLCTYITVQYVTIHFTYVIWCFLNVFSNVLLKHTRTSYAIQEQRNT